MKPQLTLVALFLIFASALSAQVKFKVKLLTNNSTYEIRFKPETSWSGPVNSTTTASQVTLRVPVGGFTPSAPTNIKGTWKLINTIHAPTEASGFDYFIYGLDAPISGSQITYTAGVEIPMFSIQNTGACTGALEIIDNENDPFVEPNSQSISVMNFLTVFGAGPVNAYIGNYTSFGANCKPQVNCGLKVFDVALIPPSACGVADGSIVIDATITPALPLQYTINYNSSNVIWQSSPVFNNLASGDTYYVAVRDAFASCLVGPAQLGTFQLQGPLTAIIQNVDLNNPDCGSNNGSITVNAVSPNGGTLEYATDPSGPWQSSSTFNNLVEGSYDLYIRDITNNCESPVGTYELTGCTPPHCILTYDLNDLGNGKYEVAMITDTTWNAPLNKTSNLQVTVKVPTGGFEASNVQNETLGANFVLSEVVVAPVEDPQYDYITFSLQNATDSLPYVSGDTIHLFTFENTGTCTGDSIRFMESDDPFVAPNSANSTAGQYISVLGYGAADAPICLAKSAVICDAVPPAPPTCLVTYEIEELAGDVIQLSIIADTTWNFPLNQTSSAQLVVKVPTGGFVVGSLTDLEGDWEVGSIDVAPIEEPTSDYISFRLAAPMPLNVYQQGVKVPIFSFKNDGPCQNGPVILMPNNDPFLPPNSLNSNVSQYIAPLGSQGETVNICLSNLPADDCSNDPCSGLTPNFGPLEACEGAAVAFIDSTITADPITSWSWDFGDNSAVSTSQSPSHTYSSSGNFEVSLTVTTQSGCSATFMEFVTVFPSPGDAPVSTYNICNGAPVTLETPDNITSAVWTPTTNLNLADPFNPIANPSQTTVYSLTATNSFGCVNTSQVTVNVVNKPVLNSVTPTNISDCNETDGIIQINASGVNDIQYGLDSGNGIVWQGTSTFANLMAGSYNVYVRNSNGSCEVAYVNNPVVLSAPVAPVLVNVATVPPNGCNDDGSITITATGGNAPLQYSIGGAAQAGNAFTGLGAGTYNVVVTNANGSCPVTGNPVVFTQPDPPTITAAPANQNICVGASANITVKLSKNISSYSITGTGAHASEVVSSKTLTFVASANVAGTTTYNIVLTDANGCSANTSFTLTAVPAPTASFTVSPTICTNGEVVLHFTGTSLNTASLNWSLAGATIISSSAQNGNTPAGATLVVKWTSAGTKTVTLEVDNGGCKVNTAQSISVSAFNPGATFDNTNASCGENNGAIDLTVTGTGYDYLWSNGQTTEDISNLTAGNYKVTITEPISGCKANVTTQLQGSPKVNFTTTKQNATDCTGVNGDGSITINVSNGTAPYTYSVTGQNLLASQAPTATFSNLVAGPYTVIVTDAVGCSKTVIVTIGSNSSQLTVNAQAVDAGCTANNGSVTATVAGGQAPYTYSLFKNNLPVGPGGVPVNGNTVTLSGLEPASYLLLFEDALGCIAAGGETVERMEGVFPATATISDASCGVNNGAISLSGVPAGATTVWVPSIGSGSGLPAGVYTATITESNGCTSSETFVISTTGGADITVNTIVPASCGLANGSITFTVSGGDAYSYKLLGTSLQGFGTPDVQTVVDDVPAGPIVIEVTDLVTQNCKVYEAVVVPGSGALNVNTSTNFSTGCGNSNGKINLTISGGQAPYTLVSTAGTPQAGVNPNEFSVNNLYEGIVNITVTDANGCVSNISQNMGDFEEPNITMDSIEVTSAICPDGVGAIASASSSSYAIFNSANGLFMGNTAVTALPPGTYFLTATLNSCIDTLQNVVVNAPPAWAVIPTIAPQGCGPDLGSIDLTVSGGVAPYSYDWSNVATGSVNGGLSAGAYSVTITDANGCTYQAEYSVIFDCQNPCDFADTLFYVDMISVTLDSMPKEICLPTNESNLEDFDLTLNNQAYLRSIGDCGDATYFYNGFNVLPPNGPFTLGEWVFGNDDLSDFQFQDFEGLVVKMNEVDPLGNWVLDNGSIFGGSESGKTYGHMKIRHDASGNTVDILPSKLNVPSPTIYLDSHLPVQMLIATDVYGCVDTLLINVQIPETMSDTIEVTVAVGETENICIPIEQLVGNLEFLANIGISFTNNAQVLSTGENCVDIVGVDLGDDQATIVICDDLGICDTTYLDINVVDGGTEILVHTAFSPNDDGINDYFKVRNIEKYPNNDIQIFNRWGERVFSNKRYKNNWSGDYRSVGLPDGTYFYFLNVEVNGEMKEFSGFVELRR